MACALLSGQRGIGMLGSQRSLANRNCRSTGSAVFAASRGSTGRRTSIVATARTGRTSSSNGLQDAYEPEHLQVPAFPPPSRPRTRTDTIVHNGASFAGFSTNSSHSTADALQATSVPAAAAGAHDAAQHAGLLLDSGTAADITAEVIEPAAAVAARSQLQHANDAVADDVIPLAAPEVASAEAAEPAGAAAAAAETPPAPADAATPPAAGSSASSSSSSSSSSTHLASVLVIEAFASSYQVARQLRLVNVDAAHTGLYVSAYAAVELDSRSHARSPSGAVVGVANDRYANIHGSLKDAAVQGQLLRFVQRMLQQSADGSGQRIDSVVVFASPAADASCDVYSIPHLSGVGISIDAAGRLQQPHDVQQQTMVRQLQQQLYEADRHASSVLELYRMIQALCAAADEAVQPLGSTAGRTAHSQTAVQAQALQPTLTRLVMVGPWNEEQLLLPMTNKKLEASRQRAAAAARQRKGLRRASPGSSVISYASASDADTADDEGESDASVKSVTASGAESDVADTSAAAAAALQDDAGSMETVPLGLHRRSFLEPQLAGSLTSGDLQVSKQPWCMYGVLKGDLPPLAVITDMQPGLPNGGCICNACDGPIHEAEADTAAAAQPAGGGGTGRNDAGLLERPLKPIWPDALVLTLMRMLQSQVVAERAAAALRANDSAATAAAAAAAGLSGRAAKRVKAAAKKKGAGSSSKKARTVRPSMLEPPAPGATAEERREQLRLFTKPVLAEYAQRVRGLAIKARIKKDELISKIVEDESAKGTLSAG